MNKANRITFGLLSATLSLVMFVAPLQRVFAQNPQSGAIDIGGIVPGTPPPTAATITNPTDGQRFTEANITVSGTCPVTTVVEIYKNSIFAGSTICDGAGNFSLQIDLVRGENKLLARVHDALNQYGPDSAVVIVHYDVVTISGSKKPSGGATTPLETIPQLLIVTDAVYQGQSNARPLKIKVKIIGGEKPYALSVDWGDGDQDLVSRPDNEEFTLEHLYKEAGTYQIVIKASDSVGNSAYIQVIGLVSGPIYKDASAIASPTSRIKNLADKLFPILIVILLAVSVFWLGKRYEYHELKEDHRLIEP